MLTYKDLVIAVTCHISLLPLEGSCRVMEESKERKVDPCSMKTIFASTVTSVP